MSTITKGVRYLVMNTLNGAVTVVVSKSRADAMIDGRSFFGRGCPLHVVQDTLSTR